MLKNFPKIMKLLAVLFFTVAITYSVYMFLTYHGGYGGDTWVDVFAVSNAINHLPIYSVLNTTPYIYPPASLWVFMPLIYFPPLISSRLWLAFSLLCYFGIFYLIRKLFYKKVSLWLQLGICTLFLYSFPTMLTLRVGQINLVIPFLTTLAFYLLKRNQAIAGILLGLAVNLKITAGLLVIYLIFKKRWLALYSLFGTVIFSNIATVLILDIKPSDLLSFFHNISGYSLMSTSFNIIAADSQLNQSFSRFFYSFTSNLTMSNILSLLTFLILTVLILRYKKLSDWFLFNFLLISSIMFFGVYTWEHHLVFFIPLLASIISFRWNILYVIIFASFYFNPYPQILYFGNIFDLNNPIFLLFRFHAIFAFILLTYLLLNAKVHAKAD